MARFHAHRLPDGAYVLDCQAELLSHLTTRFVVPLVPVAQVGTPMARLNPRFDVEGQELVMMTQFSAAVSARSIGKPLLSLEQHHYVITTALDMLVSGY